MSPGSAPLDLTRWSSSQAPPSPPRHIPSQQLYPASQPTTPAGKYETGSRNLPNRGRGASSRTGFRDVNGRGDLKPIINDHPSGRRADPNSLGRYLSPLKCLTIALPQTYALCNHAFRYESSDNPRRVLTKPSKPVHNNGVDNEDWDYILYVNDVLGGEHGGDRYLILDVLGQGTFGQVVKCQNMRTHDICAVKVVKNKPAYHNQSKMEVAILDLLNQQYDPNDSHHILRMLESFTHKSHLCLVFECLSSNLYELIKQNQFKGLSTQLVKVFTQQLLDCLTVLKEARLIHCDLKPENILLKSLQSPQIKVIDFGSACHEMQTVYTYVQSRFYRCPEVLLGLHYNTAIDMWSLGCIVVELFLGLPLFPGTSEYNQISRIVDMLGNPPTHILENGKQTHEFFNYNGLDAHGRKQYRLKPMEQYASEHRTNEQPSKQYFKQTKLKDIIMEYPFSKKNPKQSDIDKEMANRRAFVDFVEGLINMDPLQRWTPAQAAKHPYITGEKFTGHFEVSIDTSLPSPHPLCPSEQYFSLPICLLFLGHC
ncbi:kinase-like domain-containing protein [Naematelia encephala]|uniref:Kinase-like domain-containing protein n=1 Tax=Naematelia encephala TaxID=71784 RepID=A0A1Y2BFC3_9TREE|nr:kinase-like domain-containing protein [Naematelia encephala]